jgi:methylmalonyl-CoA mutase N-terminal domain/subunit
MSRGEGGKEGVAVSTLKDFEVLFSGIPLDRVTTSMTINASAIFALCAYIAVAEKQGVSQDKLGGTIQNDVLKEYIAQKEWVVGPRPATRVVVDMIEYTATHMPKWHPVSISGYHIREAGATGIQELAFTLADGFGYVEECVKRGMDVDDFAARLSFFWDVHNDFFEEIAKFRAARRIYARVMRDRFGAKKPISMTLRTHAQTAGVSLTAQQPYNNVVRTTLQALAAVLGGTQSLHTNSLDETYALPTEEAVTIAMRTQQIIAHESGVDRAVDPLAGSYYVEYLTDETEKRAMEILARIDRYGGIIRAIEEGYPQREIADSAYQWQREVDSGERNIVGVNAFRSEAGEPIPTLKIDDNLVHHQIERLSAVRRSRSQRDVQDKLRAVENACRGEQNLMHPVLDAVKAYATLGEVCDVFRKVWGAYRRKGPSSERRVQDLELDPTQAWRERDLRRLLRGLLHRLDLERQLHLVADQQSAGLESLVPLQTEVAAVDAGARDEAGSLAAPGILAAALVGALEGHGPRDPVHRQVPGDPVPVSAKVIDPGAAEGRGRKLLHVEEVG